MHQDILADSSAHRACRHSRLWRKIRGLVAAHSLMLCGLAYAESYSVSGRVVNAATDDPVRKVVVTFKPVRGSHPTPIVALTDGEGTFTAKGVEAGSYAMTVERSGFLPYVRRNLLTIAGHNVAGIIVRVVPQAVVAGRVFDDDGEPLAGARVAALRSGYRVGKQVFTEEAYDRTDDRGEYRLTKLPPGRYVFRAVYRTSAVGGRGYVPVYHQGAADVRSALIVSLAPGGSQQIDFTMERTSTFRITGRISAAGLGITPRLTLLPRLFDGEQFRRQPTTAGPDGTFVFEGVPPGDYTLIGELYRNRSSYGVRLDVSVADRDIDSLDVQLSLAQDVHCRASIENDFKIEWSRVILLFEGPDTGRGIEVRPRADGTFDLPQLMPESFTLQLKELPASLFLKSARFGDQDVLLTGMDLSRAIGYTLELLFSPEAGELSGSVVGRQGRAGDNYTVVLIPEKSRRNRSYLFKAVESDGEGRFRLSGVAPGDYVVSAWEGIETDAWFDPAVIASAERLGERMTIVNRGSHSVQLNPIAATAIAH